MQFGRHFLVVVEEGVGKVLFRLLPGVLKLVFTVVRSDRKASHLVEICSPFGVWPSSMQEKMKLKWDSILLSLSDSKLLSYTHV